MPLASLKVAKALFESAADLVMGSSCAGCADEDSRLLCPLCAAALAAPARPVRPTPCPPGLPRVWAVADYADPVRQVLLAHKERGRLALARPLGAALGQAVVAAAHDTVGSAARGVLLVPVPSSAASVRARGHDPVLRMARQAARLARAGGVAARVSTLLRHVRRIDDQAGLDSVGRMRNLHRALAARTPFPPTGLPVIVVDDVITTGATLVEASRATEQAGARPVAAAVIAATVRRTSR